jgi:hypothetical protein
MILIYAHTSPPRLQYICRFIFKEQLGMAYSLTVDAEGFKAHDGPKINYSDLAAEGHSFTLAPHPLLFEKDIQPQQADCFEANGNKAFFKTEHSDFPFDIFAASFYLVSRYEEYLPHELDMYGRYAHEQSLAYREGFLNIPLVNYWIQDLSNALLNKFPSLKIQTPVFTYQPTYDIDMAWSYKSKGLLRNIGGFIKQPSLQRLGVLAGVAKDPFDSYDFMDTLHRENDLKPVYFFLVATSPGIYDKNISPYAHRMWQLMKRHAKQYTIGLHPSWKSYQHPNLLKREKKVLETAADIPVTRSRQHYIKFSFPDTFEALLQNGITDDYSMGYGSINGFRASVASSFNWYNIKTETITALRLHPFCFMDANSFYEQTLDARQALEELVFYLDECKKINGTLISIFHNNFLGTGTEFEGWKEMYIEFIHRLR